MLQTKRILYLIPIPINQKRTVGINRPTNLPTLQNRSRKIKKKNNALAEPKRLYLKYCYLFEN